MTDSYTPRKPTETPLYEIVEENLEKFFVAHPDLPSYVRKELQAFLKCGLHDYGFARFKCSDCKNEKIVPFSCKKRGFCPSCAGRRMSETTENLLAKLPDVPYRQWVLSLPRALRYWLAKSNKLLAKIHDVFVKEVSNYYEGYVEAAFGVKGAKAGSITAIQRFSSSLMLNIHFHSLFLDGCYVDDGLGGVSFFRVPPPSDHDVGEILESIAIKIIAILQRIGFLKEADPTQEELELGSHDKVRLFSAHDLIAFGENEGLSPRRIGCGFGEVGERAVFKSQRCAAVNGFSLHAATEVRQHRYKGLKKLLQYILRPGISNDRIEIQPNGCILYRLKKAFSDGTTHLQFDDQEFIERVVALIPIPYLNLVRYNGVFAPASPLRSRIVTKAVCEGKAATKKSRIEWGELIKRTFNIDVTACPCGGRLRLIALIRDPAVVSRIMRHLGLEASPPPRALKAC